VAWDRWTARGKALAVGTVVAVALGAGAVGAVGGVALAGPHTVLGSPTVVNAASSAAGGSVAKIAAAVQPSVVSITTQTQDGNATGSGVILQSDGVIITNAHVVEGAQQVSVKFASGKSASAAVLGADTANDIAVIKAKGVSGLTPATLGDSGALAVGDTVLAMGSPLGLDGSVTAGIVSALNRTVSEGGSGGGQQGGGFPPGGGQQGGGFPPGFGGRQPQQQQGATINNAIQTDAAINPGNSGGALVNGSGQIIGINTAIATTGSDSGSIGVGFAIPINQAKKAADQILSGGGGALGPGA
jgi:putative serine protease PepD